MAFDKRNLRAVDFEYSTILLQKCKIHLPYLEKVCNNCRILLDREIKNAPEPMEEELTPDFLKGSDTSFRLSEQSSEGLASQSQDFAPNEKPQDTRFVRVCTKIQSILKFQEVKFFILDE